MPGQPFLYVQASYEGVAGEGIPTQTQSQGSTVNTGFWVWLVVIGIVIPAVILGGLRAGGFQFVFKRR